MKQAMERPVDPLKDRRLAVFLAVTLVAVMGIRILVIALGPEAYLLGYLPDDAFYYFGMARGFSSLGVWTFDGGFSLTSGFHPLHAYFNALVMKFVSADAWRTMVGINLGVGWLLTSAGFGLMAAALYRRFGVWGVIGCLPVMLSQNILLNSTNALESSWVILASAVLIYSVQSQGTSRWWPAAALGAGLLGSFARIDFGGMPLILALCAWSSWRSVRDDAGKRRVRIAVMGLAGSIMATAGALVHHWLLFGDPISASARMKALWRNLAPEDGSLTLLEHLISFKELPLGGTLTLALILWTGFLLVKLLRSPEPMLRENGWLGVAAALTVAFYLFLYAGSPGVQIWYTQNFTMSALWLMASVVALSARKIKRRGFRIALACGILLLGAVNLRATRAPTWPWMISMKAAGEKLAGRKDLGYIGSWNAGVLGYLQGRSVVNLDGLANDEIYPYIRQGSLACYLRERDIRYLADFELMLLPGPTTSVRGGYADGVLMAAAVPVEVLAEPLDPGRPGTWWGSRLMLYRLDWEQAPPLDCDTVVRANMSPP